MESNSDSDGRILPKKQINLSLVIISVKQPKNNITLAIMAAAASP